MVSFKKSNCLEHLYLHQTTGKDNDLFVGVNTKGNDIYFSYPCCYDFDDADKIIRDQIIDILGTLSLTKSFRNASLEHFNELEENGSFALYSYLWIIKDFLTNGYYCEKTKIHKESVSGIIDWKKTIQTSAPLVNSKKQIIYRNIYSKVNVLNNGMINEIQKYCLKTSIDYVGWIFNLNSRFLGSVASNEHIKKVYLTHLNYLLNNTFDDNKRLMFQHFKNVVTGLDAYKNDNEVEYGIEDYDVVFERMVLHTFGSEKNLKQFNPNGQWYLLQNDGTYVLKSTTDLRPDCILINEDENGKKNAYIIDAKYYTYGFDKKNGTLPETNSIQKQITYGDYILINNKEITRVYNSFILPYNKNKNEFGTNETIFHFGFAEANWRKNKNEHEIIHSFFIDLKHLISNWNHSNHSEDIKELINRINEKSKQFETNIRQL